MTIYLDFKRLVRRAKSVLLDENGAEKKKEELENSDIVELAKQLAIILKKMRDELGYSPERKENE